MLQSANERRTIILPSKQPTQVEKMIQYVAIVVLALIIVIALLKSL